MCKVHDFLEIQRAYNWDGDRIIHDSTVSRTRTIPGTKKKYEVDIRELLLSEHNSVVKAALEGIKERLPIKMYNRFIERKEGCFDFRIQIITGDSSKTVAFDGVWPNTGISFLVFNVSYSSSAGSWILVSELKKLLILSSIDIAVILAVFNRCK